MNVFSSVIYPTPMQYLRPPPGLILQMPVGQMLVGGITDWGPEHVQVSLKSLVSRILGPQPERTQYKTHPVPG